METYCGYFDESGTHGASFMTVGGFVASERQWKEFDREWRAALRSKGLEGFKMQWFEKRKGAFKDWADQERMDFLNTLLGIITRRVNRSIFCALSMRDYDELITGKIKRGIGSAYTTAANGCLFLASEWLNGRSEAPLVHTFDKGHKNSQDFLLAFTSDPDAAKIKEQFRFSSVTLADEKDVPPLQAADLIAYESWKHINNEMSASKRSSRRYPFEQIVNHVDPLTRFYDRQGILSMRETYIRRNPQVAFS